MKKKLLLVGFIFVLLAAIPLTVYILQKQQETRSKAAASTTLQLSSVSGQVGQEVGVDLTIKPGSNQVSFVKVSLSYDSSKLATTSTSFEVNSTAFPVVLEGPIYSNNAISITLSTGADISKIIQSDTKVGTIKFKALAPASPTQITFGADTQVLSVSSADTPSENVLQNKIPGSITITGVATTPVPGQIPVCTGLNLDRNQSGVTPFSIVFTALGTDSDGTITKATFNYGDGPIQDITQTGGIGTNSVNVQSSHTYVNAGSFTATVQFTDNTGNVSALGTCTKTVTVTASSTTPQPTSPLGVSPTEAPTPTAIVIPTNSPTVPPGTQLTASPGPGDIFVVTGVAGVILSVIGVLTFFSL